MNHPNIAHIHGLEGSNGIRVLVMELAQAIRRCSRRREVLLLKAAEGAAPLSWTPDGQVLVYRIAGGSARLGLLPRAGTQKPQLFEQTPIFQIYAQMSPTGRWIAYVSPESGRYEVYVRSFPTPGGKYP